MHVKICIEPHNDSAFFNRNIFANGSILAAIPCQKRAWRIQTHDFFQTSIQVLNPSIIPADFSPWIFKRLVLGRCSSQFTLKTVKTYFEISNSFISKVANFSNFVKYFLLNIWMLAWKGFQKSTTRLRPNLSTWSWNPAFEKYLIENLPHFVPEKLQSWSSSFMSS